MKSLMKLGSIVLLFLIVQSCTTEDDAVKKSKASTVFRFSPSDVQTVADRAVPDGAKLRLSIETPDGDPVLTDAAVNFKMADADYVTEPVALPAGEYVVTSFEVLDQEKLLFLTPDASLPISKSMKHTLPIRFKASVDTQQEVNLNVVSARIAGLATSFQLGAYVQRTGAWRVAMATAYLINGPDTLATYDLAARINRLPFTLDPAATYNLVIIKPGYSRETRIFRYNDIMDTILKVRLDPAVSMLGYTHPYLSTSYHFILDSEPGTVYIDWGDGSSASFTFTAADNTEEFEHEYAIHGNHYITVTGDILPITSFYSFYGNGMLDEVNLEHAVNLIDLRIGLTRGPRKINLSKNPKLTSVRVPGVNELSDLVLPAINKITVLDVAGPNSMNMPEVSGLVNNIYNNTVVHGLPGYIDVGGSWWDEPGSPMFVGPPSAAAKIKLKALRDSYGWSIDPNF